MNEEHRLTNDDLRSEMRPFALASLVPVGRNEGGQSPNPQSEIQNPNRAEGELTTKGNKPEIRSVLFLAYFYFFSFPRYNQP